MTLLSVEGMKSDSSQMNSLSASSRPDKLFDAVDNYHSGICTMRIGTDSRFFHAAIRKSNSLRQKHEVHR
jgi:hypothetical protein